MKLLDVVHAYPPDSSGGTERYAEAIALGMRRRGHEVAVLAGSLEWRERLEVVRKAEQGIPVTRIHRDDLYFDHWDKGANPHVARVFEQELERLRPDVVQFHQWIRLSNDLVRRAAARGVPTLLHLHDLYVTCPRVFRVRPDPKAPASDPSELCDEPLGRAACTGCVPRFGFELDAEIGASIDAYREACEAELAAAAELLAPSASHAALLARHATRPGLRFEHLPLPRLPGGIDQPGRDAQSPAGRLRLLYFSHLVPIKGAHVVLEAMRRLESERSPSGVALDAHGAIGTPAYEARLHELARGLEVRFHGAYVADEPCRTPADVAVIPTLARESWSFWLDEAGRLGLPILATASGAIAERATGRVRLVPPRDAGALARAIAELRDDPARRRALAAAPPPEAMPLDAHLDALESRLASVVHRGAPRVAPPPPIETQIPEFDRRELAFRHYLRFGRTA